MTLSQCMAFSQIQKKQESSETGLLVPFDSPTNAPPTHPPTTQNLPNPQLPEPQRAHLQVTKVQLQLVEFTTLCGDRACRVREMQARVRFAGYPRNPLRRSCVSSARNAGESAICRLPAQPSAEIVRVECAKCRRECDLPAARATLCGDRACRGREMQTRVRFAGCPRNPLRRSCVSSARNAGESAIWYANLVRRVAGELEAENWRRGSARVVRGVAGEREDENWRVGSTT